MTAPPIRLEHVRVAFGPRIALDDVHTVLPAGTVTAVIGAAGAGKTTLLRCIDRLIELEPRVRRDGRVLLGEDDVDDLDPTALRRRVGMVFDTPTAFSRSVQDNVGFGLQLAGVPGPARDDRIESALRRAGLWEGLSGRLDVRADLLDAGVRQQICIARALALEPQVLLLDEPTLRLHPAEGARIERVVRSLVPDITVVFATSDAALAGRIARHVVLLDSGRVVEAGSVDEVFTNPREAATQAFLSRRY